MPFSVGTKVRIKSGRFLNIYEKHKRLVGHCLRPDQFGCAGRMDFVRQVRFEDRGDALYELMLSPGLWPHECIEEYEDEETD